MIVNVTLLWILGKAITFHKVVVNSFLLIFCVLGGNPLKNTLQASQNNALVEQNKLNLLQDNQYLLGAGDILELTLFDVPEFSGDYKILNDGRLYLPLIGSINVNNLALEEASEIIENKFSKELIRPELFLSVKVARPIKVSIIGEIETPGLYSLTNNETTNLEGINQIKNTGLPTIVDAIQRQGYYTKYGFKKYKNYQKNVWARK